MRSVVHLAAPKELHWVEMTVSWTAATTDGSMAVLSVAATAEHWAASKAALLEHC